MDSYFFIPANLLFRIPYVKAEHPNFIIIDLEDAIKQSDTATALQDLAELVDKEDYFIRVPLHQGENLDLTTLNLLIGFGYKKFVLPKLGSGDELDNVIHSVNNPFIKFLLLIETPRFLLEADRYIIKHAKQICGLGLGSHDLMSIIGGEHTLKNLEYHRQHLLILARLIDAQAIDIASMELRDEVLFTNEILDGFSKGYDAKFLIHPVQLQVLNAMSFYNEQDEAWATKVIEVLDGLASKDEFNPIVVDGKVIEKPHLNKAKKIINFINKKHGK